MQPNDRDELPELLRSLQEQRKPLPTPAEDYFDEMARHAIREGRPASQRFSYRWLAVAASLLLAVSTAIYLSVRPTDPVGERTADALLAEIGTDDIRNYLDEYVETYETDLLYEATLEQ